MSRTRARGLVYFAIVLGLALAMRLPHLQTVPHLTDETGEVLFARAITFEGARPFTHTDAYNGPLWPYLLAIAFRTFGSSAALPRLFALALGMATVAATFALGWVLAPVNRRAEAALIAGALAATSFTHTLVGSRVAWSNSSTPLWTTLGVLTLLAAVRRRSGPLLVAAGFLGGLALHTHPSVSVFLAALVVWFVSAADRRAWLRSRWPRLAVAGAVLAYGPVIYFNWHEGLQSIREASASANAAQRLTAGGWIVGIGEAIGQLGRSMAGGFALDGPASGMPWLAASTLFVALTFGAAARLAMTGGRQSGRRLPLVVAVTTLVGLPLFNRNWHGFLEARYLAFTLPLLYASFGSVVAASTSPAAGRTRRLAVSVALIALPALRVMAYEDAALAEQFDNRRLWHMARSASREAEAGAMVMVDIDLKHVAWRAGGHPRRAVEYLLALEGIPFARAPAAKINHFLDQGDTPLVLFLAGPTAVELGARYRLAPVDVTPRPGEGAWGLYVAGPAAERLGAVALP